ncbi:MAG: hypothetical protein HYV09_36150 [Deltaproteobacteria bacterium]|nr:hypothetical protein [Deltaproteobacteria bacterium]
MAGRLVTSGACGHGAPPVGLAAMSRAALLLPLLATLACAKDQEQAYPDAADDAQDVAIDAVDDAFVDASDATMAPEDGAVAPPCIDASGTIVSPLDRLTDGADVAQVTKSGDLCRRTYVLSTTVKLRDSMPGNPRTVAEQAGAPFVRTNNDVFDALYALALAEAKEDSVDSIRDGAFNDGKSLPCAPGGCFETGRLWTYVWTRDVAYSVHLALAGLDPTRARNSLEFKLSERRTGGDLQIVQDTGTGGSYPISTDRVVWALGARELLGWLEGAERTAFRDRAYDAIKNTIEHDRKVVFDDVDGLYRGEQSFLDWREQTYPPWTATDTVHIGMSKALSTNVLHLAAIDVAARLAAEKGDAAGAAKYAGWRDALRARIGARFWLEADQQLSTYVTTTLDPSPVRRFDALGTALAVLLDATSGARQAQAIASYPLVPKGVPVIWPQQKETPIYHNRAIWPFVTAYYAKAAAKVRNDAAIDHAVDSLMRGAALNLSNMENFEMVSGNAWLDDGAYSGPVVNSQRQLWSVAGYLSMVHDVVFGRVWTDDGRLAFRPAVTRKMRRMLFSNADAIALNDLRWKGKTITVIVRLPPIKSGEDRGVYGYGGVTLNGKPHSAAAFADAELASSNVIEIPLVDEGASPPAATNVVTGTSDYKNLFGPRVPAITAVEPAGTGLKISWSANGELASEVTFDVYRDGVRVASDLAGATASWTDSATVAGVSHCYAVEATFVSSKNHGQHSAPWCWWGASASRITTFDAKALTATGGELTLNYGKYHYQNWGDPADVLTVPPLVPASTGSYLIQLEAGNGAGPINTGITCGVKLVEVWEGTTLVASGRLLMPHLGAWPTWRGSSFVPVKLIAGREYRIVVKHDVTSVNMSFFEHFGKYTGGLGGAGGSFSRVNISELKVLGTGP